MNFRNLSVALSYLSLLLVAARAGATPPQFPYQATVQTEEVEVRAGPSEERYYVTGRLTRGQQVTVHRHDRGGWFMITPPPGSFSWIEASVVQRQGGDAGVVSVPMNAGAVASRAVVRIGSQLGDDHSLYGRELASGDRVRILGEQTLQTDAGPVLMLKIEPPAREYRWVKGDFLVAVDPVARRQQDLDPYRIPSSQFNSLEFVEVVTASSSEPVVETEESNALQAQLSDIDLQYADMMQLEPAQWDLDRLVQSYMALRPQGDVRFHGQIDQRLRALEARRKVYNDFLQLQQIRDATTARDQQLQSMQQQGAFPQQGTFPGYSPMPVDLGTPSVCPPIVPTDLAQQPIYPEAFPAAAPGLTGFPVADSASLPAAP
ncbi:MAG: SH3 domain-containing protein, partial [Thermomicrobiales bacterium]